MMNRELADRRTSWGVQELLQGKEGQQPLVQVVVVDDDGDCGRGCGGDDGDDQQHLLQVVVVNDAGCDSW